MAGDDRDIHSAALAVPGDRVGVAFDWARFDSIIQQRLRSRRGRKVRPKNKIEIAILEACKTPSVEHWIMIKARLGYETFWTHMSKFLREGVMKISTDGRNHSGKARTFYSLTESGLRLLDRLQGSDSVSVENANATP